MRIVSLVPSLTELVCALGLGEQLVGRTGFCVHPRDFVRRIPKVGGTKTVKLEAVRALKPTHVILNIDENRKETADALAQFVPHLVVTHPLGPLDNLALFRQFGAAFDRACEAESLCARFEEAYAAVRAEAFPARNVLYLIWQDPWMTVSPDTYISRTLALFGMHTLPAAVQERYLRLSDLHVQGVDVVLLSTEPYRFGERHRKEVEALSGRPTHLVDGEMTSWYGPRAIAGLGYLKDFAARVAGVS
ncbi:MAG: helical backbone metal receptor [Betaproteobacteria bacterium]|nr:helical backbone metal receptor [Betaproteobacteria bacterium]MDH5222878.1 helical backbone metal receptor [Betaproteobacteria bacterium]MDH5351419.1 helical backbone metal receptor [Betaproteobacteria bacterium]